MRTRWAVRGSRSRRVVRAWAVSPNSPGPLLSLDTVRNGGQDHCLTEETTLSHSSRDGGRREEEDGRVKNPLGCPGQGKAATHPDSSSLRSLLPFTRIFTMVCFLTLTSHRVEPTQSLAELASAQQRGQGSLRSPRRRLLVTDLRAPWRRALQASLRQGLGSLAALALFTVFQRNQKQVP